MRYTLQLLAVLTIGLGSLKAQDHHSHTHGDEEVFNVGEPNWFTGEGVNVGGFLFPSLYIQATGGLFEPGAGPTDFAFSDHDPSREFGLQVIEFEVGININDKITGALSSVFLEDDGDWEGLLEEYFLHYNVTDNLAIGGGQFFNKAGWLTGRHSHSWDYVNNSLVASRFYNEGELTTQGGEIIFQDPNDGVLTLAFGGVLSHGHGHAEEEEDHGDEEDEEEEQHHHGVEGDEAGFADWVFSADYKFPIAGDDSFTGNASVAIGSNGFGKDSLVYGVGVQKIWNAHDHGHGPELCEGGFLFRTEFVGRSTDIGVFEEEEEEGHDEEGHDEEEEEEIDFTKFEDFGISSRVAYGLTEHSTLQFRHEWLSGVDDVEELGEVHRFSPAYTTKLGPNKRIQMRLQYDYLRGDEIDSEHVGWLQFQWLWGQDCHGH